MTDQFDVVVVGAGNAALCAVNRLCGNRSDPTLTEALARNSWRAVQWLAERGVRYTLATGEIAGEFFYHSYPAGTGLMRGTVFGRIAGEHAARHVTTAQAVST